MALERSWEIMALRQNNGREERSWEIMALRQNNGTEER